MSDMDSPWRPQSGVLCETCAQIDFADLFTRSHKMYALSTLQDMAGRGDSPNGSPACKLFLDAIASAWKTTPDWIAQLERPIRCWIRSMFWAQHCSDTVSYESHASRHNRAILGTDWHPHEMSFHWNPTLARFTAAALDLVNEFASETLVANHAQRQLDQFAVDSFGDADELIARRLLKGTMDLTIICSWLSECQTFHTHSHSKGLVDMSQLGSSRVRVVDVVRRRLVERGAPFRYVALSYVWGNSTSQISLERVFDADLRIRMHRLPNSIYDAIKLTRALGERYLWVDWLCIDQADAAAKALLISHMDAIYQSACFTIVAAAGIDADAGLPGLFTRQRREELATSLPTRSGRILLTQSRPSLYSILQDSKWNTRGWTYQEQLLSSNRLIFTDREVFYTCPHHHSDEIPIRNKDTPHASFHYSYFSYWREAYRLETRFTRIMTQSHVDWSKGFEREADPKVEHQLSSPASELDRFAQYVQHIHEYTKRNLTNGDDAVAAFAGVLSKIWSDIELKTTLRHGLPMPSLARSLLWHAVDTSSFSKRRATGPFPSWSWAGWEGQIAHASRDVFLLESERSSTSLGSGIAAAMRILYRPPCMPVFPL